MLDIEQIRTAAQQVGLDDIGIVPATYLAEDAVFMDEWLVRMKGGEAERLQGGEADGQRGGKDKLWYLANNRDKRYDPRVLVPETQTILVGVLTFAHSGHDYHRTMKSKLYALEARLKEIAGVDIVSADHQHVFCDSAPFLERRWAERAGLGFIGKNHAFIHSTHGSLVHLGELCLSITLPLYPSTPLPLYPPTPQLWHLPPLYRRLPSWGVRQRALGCNAMYCLRNQPLPYLSRVLSV